MSFQQRGLKSLSFFMLAIGIISIVVGAIMNAFSVDAPAVAGIEDPVTAARVGGVALIVEGALYALTALLGIRSANNPGRVGAFLVLDSIVILANIVGLSLVATSGTGSVWQYILYIVVAVISGIYAVQAHRTRDDI